MTKGDQIIEQAADRLRDLSQKAAARGGVGEVFAETLAEDAEFLRKLKPSLMVARAKGEAPTNQEPGSGTVAPTGPQLGKRPKPKGESGPSPLVVVAAALAIGIVLAKMIDWRGHAHPRD